MPPFRRRANAWAFAFNLHSQREKCKWTHSDCKPTCAECVQDDERRFRIVHQAVTRVMEFGCVKAAAEESDLRFCIEAHADAMRALVAAPMPHEEYERRLEFVQSF